jgi:hypothetical protein
MNTATTLQTLDVTLDFMGKCIYTHQSSHPPQFAATRLLSSDQIQTIHACILAIREKMTILKEIREVVLFNIENCTSLSLLFAYDPRLNEYMMKCIEFINYHLKYLFLLVC